MGQFLPLLPSKMLLIISCLAATAFASPLQFERVPDLDNRIPLLVQDRVPNPCLTKVSLSKGYIFPLISFFNRLTTPAFSHSLTMESSITVAPMPTHQPPGARPWLTRTTRW